MPMPPFASRIKSSRHFALRRPNHLVSDLSIVTGATEAKTARLIILGKVDNVGFEEFAEFYARRLDLLGHMAASGDGRLDVELYGPGELIDMFEMACWLGPSEALVDTIKCSPEPASTRYNNFTVEPSPAPPKGGH
jgi:acylphosphatase